MILKKQKAPVLGWSTFCSRPDLPLAESPQETGGTACRVPSGHSRHMSIPSFLHFVPAVGTTYAGTSPLGGHCTTLCGSKTERGLPRSVLPLQGAKSPLH